MKIRLESRGIFYMYCRTDGLIKLISFPPGLQAQYQYKSAIWLIYLHSNGTPRGQHTHFSHTYSIRRHVHFISVVQIFVAVKAGI